MGFSPKPHSSHSHMPLAEINVTPMVDVMLVLLIIFMVTAPMMISGVDVNLPESQASALQAKEEKPLSVTVTKEGAIYLMEEQIDEADLLGKLQAFQKVRPKAPVMIRGDTNVQYGAVMKVIGAAGAAGFTNISLLSEAQKP